MLTDEHERNVMGAALSFLEGYHREGDEFLDRIITADETWVSHYTTESKWQSQERYRAHSSKKKKARKLK
jgi:hypothetical protein